MRKLLYILVFAGATLLLLMLLYAVNTGLSLADSFASVKAQVKATIKALKNPMNWFRLWWNWIKFLWSLITFNSQGVRDAKNAFFEIVSGVRETSGGSSGGMFEYGL